MSDRLPAPEKSEAAAVFERASATPTRTEARAPRAQGPLAERAKAPATLRDTEEWMVRAITEDPDDIDARDVVTPSRALGAAERLFVYQSGYHSRLIECLRDDYPVLAASLGDERWDALCRAYVARHPSTSPNLNAFGRHLSSFAGAWEGGDAFAADLATLEWALVEIIHAPAAAALDLGALQALPPEQWAGVTFTPSEAVRLLSFAYPVNAYYRAYRESGEVPARPAQVPATTVVYRAGGTLWRMDLTPAMAGVLAALLGGATLGDALASITDDEAERSVMIWFREWVSGGIFAAVHAAIDSKSQ